MKLNIAIFTAFLLFTGSLIAQPLSPTETNIPVRDGQTLAADIYIPQPEISRPTILIQTPYNKLFYRYSLPPVFDTFITTKT
jgi:predicted acyl esterase